MYVVALLIDLTKAFDTVSHQKLLIALAKIGCCNQALNWFTSYLPNRTQRVVQSYTTTEWKPVSRGVPQGSGISPKTFKIYARKLSQTIQSSSMQFADDFTISEFGRRLYEISEKLAASFCIIQNYCEELDLQVNTKKTQLIRVQGPRSQSS